MFWLPRKRATGLGAVHVASRLKPWHSLRTEQLHSSPILYNGCPPTVGPHVNPHRQRWDACHSWAAGLAIIGGLGRQTVYCDDKHVSVSRLPSRRRQLGAVVQNPSTRAN